jgi:hypothetical protein
MSVSKDGKIYGSPSWQNLGVTADYSKTIRLGPNVGKFDKFMGLRVQFYGDVSLNVDGVYFD